MSRKRSPSISASSAVIAHLCNAWLFDAWIDVSGGGKLAGATGYWWVFSFLFFFSFPFFFLLHKHSHNSCFDTWTRGKNITSPTSSCLFLIFFSFPLPLHSSHDFYFPSLVFPSVWPNGLPPYIFPHLVPPLPFSLHSAPRPLPPPQSFFP